MIKFEDIVSYFLNLEGIVSFEYFREDRTVKITLNSLKINILDIFVINDEIKKLNINLEINVIK